MSDPMPDTAPSTVTKLTAGMAEPYRIERELGVGGMATVYLAHDLRHDRRVAIKVLRGELAESLGRERFVREIRLAAKLTHPHILPLYDSGEANGCLYFVMPVMEGQTRRDRLRQEGQLSVDAAMRIASEVADALDCAHRNDVVHRDILDELRSRAISGFIESTVLATMYASHADMPKAREFVARGIGEHETYFQFAKSPAWAPFLCDPEGAAMLRAIGYCCGAPA